MTLNFGRILEDDLFKNMLKLDINFKKTWMEYIGLN